MQSFADEYDVMDYLRQHSDDAYASIISNMYESKGYFAFNYLFDGGRYLAVYDKRTGAVGSFNFDGEEMSVENISCNRDKAYIFFADGDFNYVGVASLLGLL